MNILFVSDVSIKNIFGGAERVLFEQASRLARKGNKVYIITRKYPSHSSDYELISNVHEFRYRVSRQNSVAFIVTTLLNSIRMYFKLLDAVSFDLLYFHQPFSALGINLIRRSRQTTKAYCCHSLSFEEYETRGLKSLKNISSIFHEANVRLRKYIEKYSIVRSDAVIVLSEFMKKKLVQHYQIESEKIKIIPGGVDLNKFMYNKNKPILRTRLALPKEKFIFFTVRNLVPRMGLENLIYAMKEITKSAGNIFLVIGGEGELKSKLLHLVAELKLDDYIQLRGFIPEEELPAYYQASDFFILPTKCLEGFGLVTLEAMACGTPVLGTPVGGIVEILGKFNREFLFKDTEPESLTKLILDKYNFYKEKPEEYRKLSKQCRKFVEREYSWEGNVNKIEGLFGQLKKEK